MAKAKRGRPRNNCTPSNGTNSQQNHGTEQTSLVSPERVDIWAGLQTPEVTIGVNLEMESMENWEQRTILPTEASPTLNQGTNPSLWANFDISKLRNAGHKLEYIKPQIEGTLNYTKICTEDIDPEVKYWESAVACYVLGSSPPFSVLTGFVKRIWHDLLIDKIVMLWNGGCAC